MILHSATLNRLCFFVSGGNINNFDEGMSFSEICRQPIYPALQVKM
ncbi:MAG: hypothetical protein ACE5HI_06835 [bacterium]